MENRRTKRVTLEIYEDQETKFRGLIWLLKKLLDEHSMNQIRRHYEDPSVFDDCVKEYWEFLREFFGMIYISSIDEAPVPLVDITPVWTRKRKLQPLEFEIEDEKSDKEECNDEIGDEITAEKQMEFEKMIGGGITLDSEVGREEMDLIKEIKEFVEKSKVIKKTLSQERKEDLIDFIQHQIRERNIRVYRKDKFLEAAMAYKRELTTIDTELKYVIANPFLFRYDPSAVFQPLSEYNPRKMNVRERYRLTGDLFQHMEFYFPELSEYIIGKDYQLRTITGFILAKISKNQKKKVLLDEDEYLDKMKGTKPWRKYLADYVVNWLRKANELGIEKYPTGRRKGEFDS
jgi:hypothetical protein